MPEPGRPDKAVRAAASRRKCRRAPDHRISAGTGAEHVSHRGSSSGGKVFRGVAACQPDQIAPHLFFMIRKLKSGEYRLYSRKKNRKDWKAKELGNIFFTSRGGEARAGGAVL